LTARTFAAWVRPVAEHLAADRQRVVDFARAAPPEVWAQPSAVDGWTNKDLLAHLAGGNDQMLQTILRAVTSHTALDPAALDPDTDAENDARIAERRSWTIDALITELERDGEEMQSLLAQLTDDDAGVRPGNAKWTLGQLLGIVERERHDREHLVQMQQ
jgi:uncharacterized protein (TIGR03083 family)